MWRFCRGSRSQGHVAVGRFQSLTGRASAVPRLLAQSLAQFLARWVSPQGSSRGNQLPSESVKRACKTGPPSLCNLILEVTSVMVYSLRGTRSSPHIRGGDYRRARIQEVGIYGGRLRVCPPRQAPRPWLFVLRAPNLSYWFSTTLHLCQFWWHTCFPIQGSKITKNMKKNHNSVERWNALVGKADFLYRCSL